MGMATSELWQSATAALFILVACNSQSGIEVFGAVSEMRHFQGLRTDTDTAVTVH